MFPLDWLDGIAASELAVLLGAGAIAGFLRGFVGFGAAMVNVPLLSLVTGPVAAVAISTLVSVPAVLQLLPAAIRESEKRLVGPMCAAIFATAPIGVWVLVSVDPAIMKIVISMTVVALVLLVARGWRLEHEPGLAFLLGAGTAGGLIQGAAGVGGPPVVAVALARPGSARRQRGNVLALMTAISLASLGPLWWFEKFTPTVLTASAVLFPVNAAAAWLGARYFYAGGHRLYRRAALAVLAAVGLITLTLSVRNTWPEPE